MQMRFSYHREISRIKVYSSFIDQKKERYIKMISYEACRSQYHKYNEIICFRNKTTYDLSSLNCL